MPHLRARERFFCRPDGAVLFGSLQAGRSRQLVYGGLQNFRAVDAGSSRRLRKSHRPRARPARSGVNSFSYHLFEIVRLLSAKGAAPYQPGAQPQGIAARSISAVSAHHNARGVMVRPFRPVVGAREVVGLRFAPAQLVWSRAFGPEEVSEKSPIIFKSWYQASPGRVIKVR